MTHPGGWAYSVAKAGMGLARKGLAMSTTEASPVTVTSRATVDCGLRREAEVKVYSNGITSLSLYAASGQGYQAISAMLSADEVARLVKALAPGLAG